MLVADANRDRGNAAVPILVVCEFPRSQLDVSDGIHHLSPGDSSHIPVYTSVVPIGNAADSHKAPVACVDRFVLDGGSESFFVEIAFVDHHRKEQGWGEIMA